MTLHDTAWVIDGHADTFYEVMDKGHDFFQRQSVGHTDYPRFLEGGVNLQVASLWTPAKFAGAEAKMFCDRILQTGLDTIARSAGRLLQVTDQASLDAVSPGTGTLGFMFSIEGGSPLMGSLAVLEEYYALGVRAVGLTHNHNNELADGCGAANPGGLTGAGRSVVRRIEELGMVVDVAHLADPGFFDLIDLTTKPIWASHALCRALMPIPRNLSDPMIRAIAETRGVIGVDFIAQHMKPFPAGTTPRMSVEDVCDHVDHIVDLVGIEHVGIGSDFDGYDIPIAGLADVSELPHLSAALARRGYSEAELMAFLGGNFLRVLREVL